jgi:peptidoglycan/LPS O-acetylase OafA/YrhL
MKKLTPTFAYSLATISILGFISIIGNTWFNWTFLDKYTAGLIFLILGGGLIIESQIKRWRYMRQNGISNEELTHIVTGIVGLLSVVVGLMELVAVTSIKFEAIKGLVASIAVVVIAIETWLVK